jgi:diguanylate cyclase (GGDEF)-like protein
MAAMTNKTANSLKPDPDEPQTLRSVSVLHVEDDTIIQFHMRTILEKRVRELFSAADGVEGLAMFRAHAPDVIITDIRVPRMNGLEMIEIIRETDPDIPVIVTSAYSDADYLLKAIELGVDKYLIKPFDHRQVVKAVSRAAEGMARQREINEANRFNRFLLDINPSFIVVLDDGEVEYVNSTFLSFMGFRSLEAFILSGRDIADFVEDVGGHQDATRIGRWFEEITGSGEDGVVVRLKGCDERFGGVFWATFNRFPETRKYVVVFTDITRLDDERKLLSLQARTDHLTGVANRLGFSERLQAEIARAERYGQPLSLIMFDIDDFKRVNDEHGHEEGDRVLKALAKLVWTNIRTTDLFGRWGGEEFLVATPNCDLDQALRTAEKLRDLLCEAAIGPGRGISCSFGVTSHRKGESMDAFLRRLDEALYVAKKSGKDTISSA